MIKCTKIIPKIKNIAITNTHTYTLFLSKNTRERIARYFRQAFTSKQRTSISILLLSCLVMWQDICRRYTYGESGERERECVCVCEEFSFLALLDEHTRRTGREKHFWNVPRMRYIQMSVQIFSQEKKNFQARFLVYTLDIREDIGYISHEEFNHNREKKIVLRYLILNRWL